MQPFDLTLIWAGIIAFGVIMYVLMDGFDLGVGILFPLAPDEESRDLMMNSVAPVWDGNETWLVLWRSRASGRLSPGLHHLAASAVHRGVPDAGGADLPGVAFEFRFKANRSRYLWNIAFCGGSTVAALAQGIVVGTYVQGIETEGGLYVGGALDWLTPFSVLTGLGLVAGYALLGSTWTIMKTEGATQAWAYRITPWLLAAVLVVFAIISVWTPFVQESVYERWFSQIHVIWLFPAPGAVLCLEDLASRAPAPRGRAFRSHHGPVPVHLPGASGQ